MNDLLIRAIQYLILEDEYKEPLNLKKYNII